MSIIKLFGAATLLAATIAAPVAYAQGVPGKDRPIRVGQFKGTGQGRYWHTNIHTSGQQLAAILANPTETGLGPDVIVPTAGFSFTQFGLASGTGRPSNALRDEFLNALDTLDVAIISCFVDLGNSFTAGEPRTKFMNFVRNKGYVAVHATTDSYGTWPELEDSVHAARFQNHPSSDRNGRLRLDSLDGSYNTDPAWAFLNRSLADTTFTEEWFSFFTNGNVIRGNGVKVTVNIDETSYQGGMGGARSMGTDHPMSWYRTYPEGGRFFYTAVGHRANLWQGGAQPRFLRRQLYNAILWAAGYDTVSSATSIRPATQKTAGSAELSRMNVAQGTLSVTMLQPGTHSVEVKGVDGRRIDMRRGEGQNYEYTFTGLRAGVYAVTVNSGSARSSRLVTIQ